MTQPDVIVVGAGLAGCSVAWHLLSHANVLILEQGAQPGAEANLGGVAFICGPEGDVLATTDAAHPFATLNIDLDLADRAKATYPRYVID